MHCEINLILALLSKSGYDSRMFTLHKGECEHCSRAYRYMLLHAGFGDFSYAYCDCCGTAAVFSFTNKDLANLPPNTSPNQVITSDWEPFLRPCSCSGHFRRGASPRCVACNSVLSAEYAGNHIEQNFRGAARGWHWQQDWTGTYCLVIEDPTSPGTLRQIPDPIIKLNNPNEKTFKRFLTHIFSPSR